MRNLFTLVIVVVSMFATAVYAGNPEVSFKGTELSINGVSYSVKGYMYQDGAYDAIKTADFVHVFKLPQERGSAVGDWCDFLKFNDGSIAITYGNIYAVFDKTKIGESQDLKELRSPEDFKYITIEQCAFCGMNPWLQKQKLGYFYADKDGEIYAILFGK